jgi:hypothetical protein
MTVPIAVLLACLTLLMNGERGIQRRDLAKV